MASSEEDPLHYDHCSCVQYSITHNTTSAIIIKESSFHMCVLLFVVMIYIWRGGIVIFLYSDITMNYVFVPC